MKTAALTVLLLVGSNTFMITAWYWHLKFENRPIWLVILISWGIAFFEYCLQVPANRWESGGAASMRFAASINDEQRDALELNLTLVF